MKPAIKTKDLTVIYDDFLALNRVDFECKDGEFVAIVGKSGSGKSSLLNALAGFIPYSGKIQMPGNIGYVFQDHALFPWMTVEGNIAFGLQNLKSKDKKERVNEMVRRIGMANLLKRYPNQLSGGQVQRVALARAIAPDPDVLLMDEPYGALDHHTRDQMQDWLLSVWRESRKSVLFVTHYVEEAIFLADRILVLHDKSFVSEFTVSFPRPRKTDIRFTDRFSKLKHDILASMRNGQPTDIS